MRKVFFIGAILFSWLTLSAQDYKITDFQADSLTTWQIMIIGEAETSYDKEEDISAKNNNSKSSFGIVPTLGFTYKKIRSKSLEELEGEINSRYSKDINNAEEDGYKGDKTNRDYSLAAMMSYSRTEYLIGKFGVYSDFVLMDFYQNRSLDDETQENRKTEQDISANTFIAFAEPGVKFGRIYDGEFGSKAHEIVSELKKNGYAQRDLTKDEYFKLSQIILERREIYHFDDRLKKIEALKEIVGYLTEIGVIEKGNISAVLIAEDIYSYDLFGSFNEHDREFGLVSYFTYRVAYQKAKINTDSKQTVFHSSDRVTETHHEQDTERKDLLHGIRAGIQYSSIPYWNLYYSLRGSMLYYFSNLDETMDAEGNQLRRMMVQRSALEKIMDAERDNTTLRLSFNADVCYQLDSRSMFFFDWDFYYENLDSKMKYPLTSSSDFEELSEDWGFDLVGTYRYYITPKMNYDFKAGYHHGKEWNNPDNMPRYGYKNKRFQIEFRINYFL